jgi:heptosyltransferase-2
MASCRKRWRLGRDLAARGYDAVYVLPNSQIGPGAVAGRHSQRVGFTGESRYGLINVRHDWTSRPCR